MPTVPEFESGGHHRSALGVALSTAAAAVLTVVSLPLSAAAAKAPAPVTNVQRARFLMGTICSARASAADTSAAAEGIALAFDEIARLEHVLSSWRDDSELARLNVAGTRGLDCSPDLYAALDSARVLANQTDGAFDPTIEPLNLAWDARGAGRVPGEDALARAVRLVDWHALELDPESRRARFARAGMGVDLGGIGKGFALDRIVPLLRGAGAPRALVNFGGEVLAIGSWDVAIADPTERLRAVARITVEDAAVSTSAQSERGIEAGGRRYGHILDPSTGRPVDWSGSVTVVARSATRADALSTALLVMGRDHAAAYASAHPEAGVLWLEPDSDGLRAWCWNLPRPAAEPGARIIWMDAPPLDPAADTKPRPETTPRQPSMEG